MENLAKNIPDGDTDIATSLSDDARALLAELSATSAAHEQAPALELAPDPTTDPTPELAPEKKVIKVQSRFPVLNAPVNDRRVTAFANLLNHLDEVADPANDDTGALAAARNWQIEKTEKENTGPVAQEGNADADLNNTDMSDEGISRFDATLAADIADAEGMGVNMPLDAAPDNQKPDNKKDAVEYDEGDNQNDPYDAPVGDARTGGGAIQVGGGGFFGLFRFFGRFGRSGSSVRQIVGVKDAAAAYDAQTAGTLLPYTIARAVILLLVAAVPPLVNLMIIQPQISDNNQRLTDIGKFEAQAKEDEKQANALAEQVTRSRKTSQTLLQDLPTTSDFTTLFNNYLVALQRYGVGVMSYNVRADTERSTMVGEEIQGASIIELTLVGRYDVYTEIRRIFVEQSNRISVLDEKFKANPETLDLNISVKMLVPTRGLIDSQTVASQEAVEGL